MNENDHVRNEWEWSREKWMRMITWEMNENDNVKNERELSREKWTRMITWEMNENDHVRNEWERSRGEVRSELKITRATPRRGLCESRQTCRAHPLLVHSFYCKCIAWKCLTLKMKVKVVVHNNCNDAIRWQIWIFSWKTSHNVELFFTISKYDHFTFLNLEI